MIIWQIYQKKREFKPYPVERRILRGKIMKLRNFSALVFSFLVEKIVPPFFFGSLSVHLVAGKNEKKIG